jgi:hypothetical protein
MRQVAIWLVVASICVIGIFNGALMLASPQAWNRLPPWFRAGGFPSGTVKCPLRSIRIRLTGLLILAIVGMLGFTLLRSLP